MTVNGDDDDGLSGMGREWGVPCVEGKIGQGRLPLGSAVVGGRKTSRDGRFAGDPSEGGRPGTRLLAETGFPALGKCRGDAINTGRR
jgi:hypothetical protein